MFKIQKVKFVCFQMNSIEYNEDKRVLKGTISLADGPFCVFL